jgi:hypothetical protein
MAKEQDYRRAEGALASVPCTIRTDTERSGRPLEFVSASFGLNTDTRSLDIAISSIVPARAFRATKYPPHGAMSSNTGVSPLLAG